MAKLTILQTLKKIKHLDRKIEKADARLARWCSYLNIDVEEGSTPPYEHSTLLQQLSDWRDLRATLIHSLHKANLENTVEYKDKETTIDELLILRTKTLPDTKKTLELMRRKEKNYNNLRHLGEDERKEVKVITQFSPAERDKAIDRIEDDMAFIDQILDELNISVQTTI